VVSTEGTIGETTGGMTGETIEGTTGEMIGMSARDRLCVESSRSGISGGGHDPHSIETGYRFAGSDHPPDAPHLRDRAEEACIGPALEVRIEGIATTVMWGRRIGGPHRHRSETRSTLRRCLHVQLRGDLHLALCLFVGTTDQCLSPRHGPIYRVLPPQPLRFRRFVTPQSPRHRRLSLRSQLWPPSLHPRPRQQMPIRLRSSLLQEALPR
jgi:hypothetical protein